MSTLHHSNASLTIDSSINQLKAELQKSKTEEKRYFLELNTLTSIRSQISSSLDQLSTNYQKQLKSLQLKVKKLEGENKKLLKKNSLYEMEIQNFEKRMLEKDKIISSMLSKEFVIGVAGKGGQWAKGNTNEVDEMANKRKTIVGINEIPGNANQSTKEQSQTVEKYPKPPRRSPPHINSPFSKKSSAQDPIDVEQQQPVEVNVDTYIEPVQTKLTKAEISIRNQNEPLIKHNHLTSNKANTIFDEQQQQQNTEHQQNELPEHFKNPFDIGEQLINQKDQGDVFNNRHTLVMQGSQMRHQQIQNNEHQRIDNCDSYDNFCSEVQQRGNSKAGEKLNDNNVKDEKMKICHVNENKGEFAMQTGDNMQGGVDYEIESHKSAENTLPDQTISIRKTIPPPPPGRKLPTLPPKPSKTKAIRQKHIPKYKQAIQYEQISTLQYHESHDNENVVYQRQNDNQLTNNQVDYNNSEWNVEGDVKRVEWLQMGDEVDVERAHGQEQVQGQGQEEKINGERLLQDTVVPSVEGIDHDKSHSSAARSKRGKRQAARHVANEVIVFEDTTVGNEQAYDFGTREQQIELVDNFIYQHDDFPDIEPSQSYNHNHNNEEVESYAQNLPEQLQDHDMHGMVDESSIQQIDDSSMISGPIFPDDNEHGTDGVDKLYQSQTRRKGSGNAKHQVFAPSIPGKKMSKKKAKRETVEMIDPFAFV